MIFYTCLVGAIVVLGISDVINIMISHKLQTQKENLEKRIDSLTRIMNANKRFSSIDLTHLSNKHGSLVSHVEELSKKVSAIESFLTEHGKQ